MRGRHRTRRARACATREFPLSGTERGPGGEDSGTERGSGGGGLTSGGGGRGEAAPATEQGAAGRARPGGGGLAALDWPNWTLLLPEAGTKHRASLPLVRSRAGLAAHDPGGVEPLDADLDAFRAALTRENHTLKRALTDPTVLS